MDEAEMSQDVMVSILRPKGARMTAQPSSFPTSRNLWRVDEVHIASSGRKFRSSHCMRSSAAELQFRIPTSKTNIPPDHFGRTPENHAPMILEIAINTISVISTPGTLPYEARKGFVLDSSSTTIASGPQHIHIELQKNKALSINTAAQRRYDNTASNAIAAFKV
jgi:hypothetical protein